MTLLARDLLGNGQSLDGGAMFGNAPKAMWQTWLPPDEQNRIAFTCRALLLQVEGKWVLLETGIGAFFEPKLRERYGVLSSEHVLLRSLAAHGLTHEDIDIVVLSHLHFDHAGGLLSAHAPGEAPRLLFPKASFVTSRVAFERAEHPHLRDRASFIPGLTELLKQSGRLLLVDGEHHDALGDALRFRQSHGHTPGMLHTLVCGKEQRIFFCADLVPGTAWVHLPITMGYDRYPEALIDEKQAWLGEFAQDGTWLYYTHDPKFAMSRVTCDDKGRFVPTEPREHLSPAVDLDVG